MTTAESLVILGLSERARAPSRASGCGALDAARAHDRAAFTAMLRHRMDAGPQRPEAAPTPGDDARGEATLPPDASERTPQTPEEAERSATSVRRRTARRGPRATEGEPSATDPTAATAAAAVASAAAAAVEEAVVAQAAAAVSASMPLDLIEEAASSDTAPEPDEAGAEDVLAITAVAPSGAMAPSQATSRVGTTPSPRANATEAVPAPNVRSEPARPADELLIAGTGEGRGDDAEAAREGALSPTAPRAGDAPADPRGIPVLEGTPASAQGFRPTGAPSAAAQAQGREESAEVGDLSAAPPSTGHATPAAPRAEPSVATTAPERDGAPTAPAQTAPGGPASDVRAAPSAAQRAASARAMASGAPADGVAQTAVIAEQVSAGERSERHAQPTPADATPVAVLRDPQATATPWLHASEGVAEGHAVHEVPRALKVHLADDIAGDIQRLTFLGQDSAVLQLEPRDLGKLNIHLAMQDGGLSIEMVVESEAVKAIVESTLEHLQTSLAEHGLETAAIMVQVGASSQRDAAEHEARRGVAARNAVPALGRIEASPAPQEALGGHDSTVDYRI